jgi:hypothetical protein
VFSLFVLYSTRKSVQLDLEDCEREREIESEVAESCGEERKQLLDWSSFDSLAYR